MPLAVAVDAKHFCRVMRWERSAEHAPRRGRDLDFSPEELACLREVRPVGGYAEADADRGLELVKFGRWRQVEVHASDVPEALQRLLFDPCWDPEYRISDAERWVALRGVPDPRRIVVYLEIGAAPPNPRREPLHW